MSLPCLRAEESDGDKRRAEYERIQKELEVLRPAQDAKTEDVVVFLEQAREQYGAFAKKHTKTAEGFEAAFQLLALVWQLHPASAKPTAELAIASAPDAGVELRKIGMSWAVLALASKQGGDAAGAAAALEKLKKLDAEMAKQVEAQLVHADQTAKFQEDQQKAEAAAASVAKEASERLRVGKRPFPIEEKDIAGNDFKLSDWKGKVVLIYFWSTTCSVCEAQMPALAKLYEQQHEKGFEVLSVSSDFSITQLKNVVEFKGHKWTTLRSEQIHAKWNIEITPTSYLLDKKGVIQGVDLKAEDLQRTVDRLLRE